MKERTPKLDDQDKIVEAFRLLQNLEKMNPQIEPTLWASAFASYIVSACINSGFSHPQFCIMMEQIKEHYKPHFEKKAIENGNQ